MTLMTNDIHDNHPIVSFPKKSSFPALLLKLLLTMPAYLSVKVLLILNDSACGIGVGATYK